MIVVNLLLATICFGATGTEECQPALIGADTPVGRYYMIKRLTDSPGYGGDVIKFKETKDNIFAIHRVWTLRDGEKRRWRLEQTDPKLRFITNGCINVDEEVYEKILACCTNSELTIK